MKPPHSSSAAPLVAARNLTVEYALGKQMVRAVNGVTFEVRAGETVGLVGESGCGKSTLGRALLGLLPVNARNGSRDDARDGARLEGEVFYQGASLYARTPAERRALRGRDLALIFQDPMTRLDPLLTVEQHFRELLRAHLARTTRAAAREKARLALAEVGVPPGRLLHYPHEFSGGMRQRIMIALSLVLEPRFLVADEPTTSLDVIVEAQILDLIRSLSLGRGLATLLITHNIGLVAQAADRVAVMYAGDLVEEAATVDLFARPAHPYTQGLLMSTIHMRTRVLASIDGSPPDLADPPPACRFHPRCPRARLICAERRPPLATMATMAPTTTTTMATAAHRALCWFPGPEEAIQPQAPESEWGAPLS